MFSKSISILKGHQRGPENKTDYLLYHLNQLCATCYRKAVARSRMCVDRSQLAKKQIIVMVLAPLFFSVKSKYFHKHS